MADIAVFACDAPGSQPLRRAWRWSFGLGIAFLLLGGLAAANLMAATLVSTFIIAWLMLFASLLQIVHAFGVRRWRGFFFWLLSGILYLLAAVSVFYDPGFAVRLFTLFVAISLGLSGLFRLWVAIAERGSEGAGWLGVSGLLSLAAAAIIGSAWPADSAWVVGLILAVDLLFQGVALIFLGFNLKSVAE